MMDSDFSLPLVVAFVADLMFTTKITNVVRGLGYRIDWIGQAADLGGETIDVSNRPGEPLEGRIGGLFELLTASQPALLIFDLSNTAVPWQRWIAALKSSPATRRIPILAFGSHMNVELMEEADRVGADVVLSRSRFTADMPSLIKKYASTPPYAEINNECEKPAAALALDGIEKFNRGEYYAAHDDLEEAWREDQGATRDLYRALVQVSVAYYHIERENYRGAVKMLLRVRQWLNPLPDICRGIDIAQLRDNIFTVHDSLVDLGPKRIGEFNKTLFKPIRIEGI